MQSCEQQETIGKCKGISLESQSCSSKDYSVFVTVNTLSPQMFIDMFLRGSQQLQQLVQRLLRLINLLSDTGWVTLHPYVCRHTCERCSVWFRSHSAVRTIGLSTLNRSARLRYPPPTVTCWILSSSNSTTCTRRIRPGFTQPHHYWCAEWQ